MKQLSQHSAKRTPRSRAGRGWRVASAAGLFLILAACVQQGPEYVKPTATTAYHTPQPDAPPAPPR